MSAIARAGIGDQRLGAIEADVNRGFVPTIRVHHSALTQWLATASAAAELRDHAEALLLKMEHVMRREQAEMVSEDRAQACLSVEVAAS